MPSTNVNRRHKGRGGATRGHRGPRGMSGMGARAAAFGQKSNQRKVRKRARQQGVKVGEQRRSKGTTGGKY